MVKSILIDIRQEVSGESLVEGIKEGLKHGNVAGAKTLPTLLLYDEAGLKLFEEITYLDEYYLTNAELQVLEMYADRIAERIESGSLVLELGSGNLRKISILLRALERARKDVEYYALDLSVTELQRTLAAIPRAEFKYVKCYGLHGTYDDGLQWLKSPEIASRRKSVLTMGSSIGNFSRPDAVAFLKGFASALRPGDNILVGLDSCQDPEKVYHAYNDKYGVTHRFILNGLKHANRLLGYQAFDLDLWHVVGEYDVDAGKHHAFVSPTQDVTVEGVLIGKDERIRIEESYKYSSEQITHLWESAGLAEGAKWANATGDYALHMTYRPPFCFPLHPSEYATAPAPSLHDWQSLWAAWDTVTTGMIPNSELLSKPINLRNVCLFYIGHIPTFLAIHIARTTGKSHTQLDAYQRIFERGIDPDVDNPELCHAHSEIPDSWPPLGDILAFQRDIRTFVETLYASERSPEVNKALWLGFEHEAMHLETLLYMLVQSEKTLPPSGAVKPDFEALANFSRSVAVENSWFTIPERVVTLGASAEDDVYGWDNEFPSRQVSVHAFEAKARPITNGEYATYLGENGVQRIPASWTEKPAKDGSSELSRKEQVRRDSMQTNSTGSAFVEGKSVRTVFGPVPLKYTLEWPVVASYDELTACARWMGGRIPTVEEVKSIYEHVADKKLLGVENALGKTIPAVNGHLINDGVEETPPSRTPHPSNISSSSAASAPFADLRQANIGFKHWHPVAVAHLGGKLAGQGELGGIWEWTSTALEKHEGFEAMPEYTGYTADFFDSKHNIVLGGSWATHPRIAGRKSFVNWYQRNYPYVWAGCRLVRDF
ncbi:hypothetical protein EJ06DRAFT_483372 [Trichodelitschia bisporula]|uniref:N-methyltransferase n=1 Tax=Trichodelitschia bisporula TaxID=703511 RepID=A0A6G1HKK6_9PEZI|nr:hypothetical protein EJ06DRAFT_483372 [Trichodelitschia bisporula]